MSAVHTGASTCTSRVIGASPEEVYGAFLEPVALAAWLSPGDMTGRIHAFDGRVGGGYRMSLFCPPTERVRRGRTAGGHGHGAVRGAGAAAPEAVSFHAADPSLLGEMRLAATFEAVAGGTHVTIACAKLPPGLATADREAGSRQALEQLARRFS